MRTRKYSESSLSDSEQILFNSLAIVESSVNDGVDVVGTVDDTLDLLAPRHHKFGTSVLCYVFEFSIVGGVA